MSSPGRMRDIVTHMLTTLISWYSAFSTTAARQIVGSNGSVILCVSALEQ